MFKEYGIDTQKGKVIQIMILKGSDKWYEDFELEKYKNIFIWANSWARLSQLKKDWVVKAEYFENPNAYHKGTCKRARYKLTDEARYFYKELYKIHSSFFDKVTDYLHF